MPVSEETYLRVATEDPEGKWELHCGELRSKPPMTWEHNQLAWVLGFRLQQQLPLTAFVVRVDAGRVRRPGRRYYIPDVIVIPIDLFHRMAQERPGEAEAYGQPLPLVIEVWSPSAGDYDVTEKLPEYQRRGDREIWLLHPYERTLTAWVRRPDGSYAETVHRGGTVQPAFLPGAVIHLDELFAISG